MPFETVIVTAAITVVFGIFAAALAWAEYRTRGLS